MMYPVMLNVAGKLCVVIGGGKTALRKAVKLCECGANVKVVSREFHDGFSKLDAKIVKKEYDISDISDAFIVIAATDDDTVNRKIVSDARTLVILTSDTADAELSDFVSPASVSSGDLTLSVSTGGVFPALAKKLCGMKAADMGFYESILPILKKYRDVILSSGYEAARKKELTEYMVSDDMLLCAREDIKLFEEKIKEKI